MLEPFGRGRWGTFVRANADAFPDLFVANELERADGMPTPNRLFINQAGNTYRYAPEYGLEREVGDGRGHRRRGRRGRHRQGRLAGPARADGFWAAPLPKRPGHPFYRRDRLGGSRAEASTDATLADVNGDAWPDVIEVTPSKLSVLRNTNGSFSLAFSAPLSSGLAVAAGDVNGDGRPDLYVMRGEERYFSQRPGPGLPEQRDRKQLLPDVVDPVYEPGCGRVGVAYRP